MWYRGLVTEVSSHPDSSKWIFLFYIVIYDSQQRSIWYHCTHQNNGGDLETPEYCSRKASGKEIQIWNNPVCFLTQRLLQWGHLFLCVLFIVFIASVRHAQLRIQTPARRPPTNFFHTSHASAAWADTRERDILIIICQLMSAEWNSKMEKCSQVAYKRWIVRIDFLEVVKRRYLVWISEVAARLGGSRTGILWEESKGANIMEGLQYAVSCHGVRVLFQCHPLPSTPSWEIPKSSVALKALPI